ncbi:MAG: alpha-2-macroglobulin [Treponema sp.]|nr:alpha-2-macroglobulin [Treponema sp.]
MKKSVSKCISSVLLIILSALIAFSCKDKGNGKEKNGADSFASLNADESSGSEDFSEFARTYSDDFFELDYSPEYPESKPIPLKLGASGLSAKGAERQKERTVRSLDDYKTKYNTARKNYSDFNFGDSPDKVAAENSGEEFSVLDWGPKGIVAENEYPTFYVVFSEPVRALTALKEPTSSSDVFDISPKIKGTYRWLGTDQLAFEAAEGGDPGKTYTISVSKSLKSISGKSISGELSFSTKAADITVQRVMPGTTLDKYFSYSPKEGVPPNLASNLIVCLNMKLDKETFRKAVNLVDITDGYSLLNYSAEPVFVGKYRAKFDKDRGITDTFALKVSNGAKIPFDHQIGVEVANFKAEFTSKNSYWTLKPFVVSHIPSQVSYSKSDMLNPLSLYFTQTPSSSGIENFIRITKSDGTKISVGKENVKVLQGEIVVYNLGINEYGSEYVIELDPNMKDIYGQKLTGNNFSKKFRVPEAKSYFSLSDSGPKMLEWQFPHKIAFDYQNIKSTSKYMLKKIGDPLVSSYRDIKFDLSAQPFPETPENMRRICTVDLDPYLDDGYGFVEFDTKADTYYWSQDWYTKQLKKNDTSDESRLTVQVTDLGVTARIGINRAVVLVRSLSTNKPVENAEVSITLNDTSEDDGPFGELLDTGKTDKDGFVVIKLSNETMEKIENSRGKSVALLVKNGKDRAIFVPSSHGYNWHSIKEARRETPRVFMFTDRGVYKPGETVSFRGIDKTQIFGKFKSYTGPYTIEVKSTSWRDETVYASLSGDASESGGFFGSFALPNDLEPGNYRICYRRSNDSSYYGTGSLYFLVAYFEPVKFQTEIDIPSMTYYAGDSVNAKIKSSYLAGGVLGDASYVTTWLRNPISFSPDTPETQGYKFGPNDMYDATREVEQNAGRLSADGEANDSVQTTKTSVETPYEYHLDAAVTDASNQRISAASSIIVHPSRFYAGVKKSGSGFAKKGEKVEFSLILVDPDGDAVSSDFVSGELSAEFSRISWELTNMNGIDDVVYSSYEQVKTSVSTEKIAHSEITEGKGKISFTPQKSGRYILTLKGKDIFGNAVKTEYSFYVTGNDYYWYGADSNELNLVADKNLYNPGEKAKILLSSPLESGDYLITVEREGIFTQEVRHFDSSCSEIEIPVARNFVPVVYVSVASYSTRTKKPTHQYGEKDTDKPKGYYGVTELFVNPYVRAFSLEVESDKMVYRPGEEVTVTMRATKGGEPVKNAELTLMAVDRAVLDLINYHVPNPVEYFYDKYHFQNYVQGGDSRDMLMDPVTYAIKNLQGGDAEADGEKDDGNERKNFKSTALFEPIIVTDEEGIAKVTFTLPDNLTTFRLTAVGVAGELFAIQENEIGVQNPINVQSVQPRRMRVRDTAECGVLLTNLDNVTHSVKVSLSIRKPEGDYEEDEERGVSTVKGEAFVDGESEVVIDVPSGASYTAYFDVGAQKAGNVELVYSVKSDVLNEKLVSRLLIEKTYVYETVALNGATNGEENESEEQYIQIPSWADDGEGSISVTLDATRLGLLSSAVDYVFNYPYGCIEQRTSAVIPLVVFEKYIDVFGLESNVKNPRKVVKAHFKYLQKYQHLSSDGGFGYWPSSSNSSFFVSLKVAQLCAYALEHGYKTSELHLDLDALTSYIEKKIEYKGSLEYRAYGYYVLSKCERYNDSKVDALYSKVKGKDFNSMLYCALYYAEQNGSANKAKAAAMAEEIRKYLQISSRTVSIVNMNEKNHWFFFGSDTEELALSLQLLVTLNPKDGMVDRLVYTLLQSQSKGYWHSTAETATVLESIYSYIKMRNLDAVKFTAQAEIMGIKLVNGKFEGAGAKPVTKSYRFDSNELSKLEKGKNLKMNFSKSGTGTLYYTTEMKYALPDELHNSRDEGIRLTYQIFDSATGKMVEPKEGSKIVELESGKTYKANIIVSTPKDRYYMALRAPIPSGAEILDANFVTSGSDAGTTVKEEAGGWGWHYMSNQVLYDNEAQFFWDDFEKGTCTVEFKFRTARKGVYPVPPVQAELMYEPEVFGRSDGYLFVIK